MWKTYGPVSKKRVDYFAAVDEEDMQGTVNYHQMSMDLLGHYRKRKTPKALLALRVLVFIGLYWILQWWRRRESNPRPQMLPLRIYMLSSRLEVSRQVCRGNRADLVLFCENLAF